MSNPSPRALRRRAFSDGVVTALPVQIAVGLFGLIFGALAVQRGMPAVDAVAMSALALAGASQLAALELLIEGSPYIVVVATAAMINLRLAMYSAALAPWWGKAPLLGRTAAASVLQDQSFALSIERYKRTEWTVGERIAFFAGTAALTWAVWTAGTIAGVMIGGGLPDGINSDFIVIVVFLALVAPMITTKPELLAALTAMAVAVAARHLPYRLGLFAGAAAGIAAGLAAQHLRRRLRSAA